MKKCLFLDRDGVINVDEGYVHKIEDFKFIDGICSLVEKFKVAGYSVVVITNQAGIGRGLYSANQFMELNNWMIMKMNYLIDKVYFCPHHPVHGMGKFKKKCSFRKPNAGMLMKAQKELDIDLSKSILIGDKYSDLDAGNNAGIKKLYLFRNKRNEHRAYSYKKINNFEEVSLS